MLTAPAPLGRRHPRAMFAGYEPAMAEVMAPIAASDITDLAHFLAHFDPGAD
jgi:hypothetical protein